MLTPSRRRDIGATAVEYALLVAGIAVVVATIAFLVGRQTVTRLSGLCDLLPGNCASTSRATRAVPRAQAGLHQATAGTGISTPTLDLAVLGVALLAGVAVTAAFAALAHVWHIVNRTRSTAEPAPQVSPDAIPSQQIIDLIERVHASEGSSRSNAAGASG